MISMGIDQSRILRALSAVTAITIFIISLLGCSHLNSQRDVLFQVSTINILFKGNYDGQMTYGELKKHGDFGMGTFNGLDGEMVGLEGKFYQVRVDGQVYPVEDSMKTPFAMVTFFETDRLVSLYRPMDDKGLIQYLETLLPSKDIFYAIKIDGMFDYIKARSVPKQIKPYPPFAKVEQKTFELRNLKGTMVGFWCPHDMGSINVPGFHFHFISEDRSAGGHLIEFQMKKGVLEIDYTSNFYMVLGDIKN